MDRYSVVEDCYNISGISAYDGNVGGIAATSKGNIKNCYSVGNLVTIWSFNNYRGGIAGDTYSGTVSSCLFIDNIDKGVGRGSTTDVRKCTEAQFKLHETYADFNTSDIWNINDISGYPYAQLTNNPQIDIEENITDFSGGEGTSYSPYLIVTKGDMENIREYKSAYYKLLNDLIFSTDDYLEGGAFYNAGSFWCPIGSFSDPFYGVFDGNEKIISGPKINCTSSPYGGLFGYVNGGTVKKLQLNDCNIKLQIEDMVGYAGGIAGYLINGAVIRCYTSGDIIAQNASKNNIVYAGGLLGFAWYAGIEECENMCNIMTTNSIGSSSSGGIIGSGYENVSIQKCFNTGNINSKGSKYVCAGGIAASVYNNSIIGNSYNIGKVVSDGASFVDSGGITGICNAKVEYCYNIGFIDSLGSSEVYFGGISGILNYPGEIENCYFFDIGNGVGNGNSTGTFAKSYLQFKQKETFTDFDFLSTWEIVENERFPIIKDIPYIYTKDTLTKCKIIVGKK